ncbi:MAG: SagB/ThcOx family dehydrogenase [Planctomycetes bacterium]|nr:SagB/ThcOx family dehydrogenase [Planctomycetota bacterium]
MPRSSIATQFHELTKYAPETIGQGHEIDWAHPPEQFKVYRGAESVDLTPYLPMGDSLVFKEAVGGLKDAEGPLSLINLSKLFLFTNGVTAVARGQGQEQFFRAAPSAGALYPTELYLLVRGHADLADGVYNYNVRNHSLAEVYPRGLGPDGPELFEKLSAACLGHPALKDCNAAVVATAIYFRSAWRYGPRGFRRCMLDSGHVLGNFDLMVPRLGLCTAAIGGFVDDEMAQILDITSSQEGVLGVFPLHPKLLYPEISGGVSALPSDPYADAFEAEPAQLLKSIHDATCILRADAATIRTAAGVDAPAESGRHETLGAIKLAPSGADAAADVEHTILRRRSTRNLTGEGLSLRELSDVLSFAYRADLSVGPEGRPRFFDPGMLHSYVVVHDVAGLQPGVYHYAPDFNELRLVKQGNFREDTYHIALGQELARDAGAVVIHMADLRAALERYGNRCYRYLHLDAGHLGQRMNLAAIRFRVGVSGIGGFFDDEVNALIGARDSDFCVYITCLGRPA